MLEMINGYLCYKGVPGLTSLETYHELFRPTLSFLPDNSILVESGTYLGNISRYWYDNCSAKNCDFFAIDNWCCDNISGKPADPEGEFDKNIFGTTIKKIKSNSLDAIKLFEDNSINLLFLDNWHEYPYTKNEILAWLPKMKINGVLAGHDYADENIGRAAREVFGDKLQFTSGKETYFVNITN